MHPWRKVLRLQDTEMMMLAYRFLHRQEGDCLESLTENGDERQNEQRVSLAPGFETIFEAVVAHVPI